MNKTKQSKPENNYKKQAEDDQQDCRNLLSKLIAPRFPPCPGTRPGQRCAEPAPVDEVHALGESYRVLIEAMASIRKSDGLQPNSDGLQSSK